MFEEVSDRKAKFSHHGINIGMSTDYQSELSRAMGALEKGIYPMDRLVTNRYKLEDIAQALFS